MILLEYSRFQVLGHCERCPRRQQSRPQGVPLWRGSRSVCMGFKYERAVRVHHRFSYSIDQVTGLLDTLVLGSALATRICKCWREVPVATQKFARLRVLAECVVANLTENSIDIRIVPRDFEIRGKDFLQGINILLPSQPPFQQCRKLLVVLRLENWARHRPACHLGAAYVPE